LLIFSGVRVQWGKDRVTEIRAPLIISNASVPVTFGQLIPMEVAQKSRMFGKIRILKNIFAAKP
jgi:hypothetical protein